MLTIVTGQEIDIYKLDRLRKKRGLSKSSLADSIGLSRFGLSRILKTGRTSGATFQRMVEKLAVSPGDLLKSPEAEPTGQQEIELLEKFRRLGRDQRQWLLGYVERMIGEGADAEVNADDLERRFDEGQKRADEAGRQSGTGTA